MPTGIVRRARPALLAGALAAVLLGAGFAGGWFARGGGAHPRLPGVRVLREQGGAPWRFINPLLECDAAEGALQRPELADFKRQIAALVTTARTAGRITAGSVYFRELNDGPWIAVGADAGYVPASLLKLPTLIAVLKREEREPGFLAREVRFAGGGDENRMMVFRPADTLVPGRRYAVGDLCRRMVQFSDNNATRLLNDLVTMPEQGDAMRALGVLPELLASEGRLSVKSVSAFFRVLYNASYLSREHSELALEMLSHASFRDGILAGVPAEVVVCSKYGEAGLGPGTRQLHEFAIVYHRRRPYLLGVMTEGGDFNTLVRFLRDASRLVYREVDRASANQGDLATVPPRPR